MEKENVKKIIETVFKNALIEKGILEADLESILDNKEIFLKIFSPWHQERGTKLIESFIENIKNTNNSEFSWLNLLDDDKLWGKYLKTSGKKVEKFKDSIDYISMRYQIPIHFHGDIDNAIIFHCMENPGGYLKDSDIKDTLEKNNLSKSLNLEQYYKKTASVRKEKNYNNSISEILKERHGLIECSIDTITNIIYSKKSNLLQELNDMFSKKGKEKKLFFRKKYKFVNNENSKKELFPYYYIANYYNQLLDMKAYNISEFKDDEEKQKQAKKISKKICNVELYPFSCKNPQLNRGGIGESIFLHSELSCLSAYIVLRRIYKYLKEDNKVIQKPIIIFRKYNKSWKKLFEKLFAQDDKIIEILEENFFYCQLAQQGGGITSKNVISVSHYNTFLNWKENDFEEVKKVLKK